MDEATLAGLCIFVDLLDMHALQHTCGVLQQLDSTVHWHTYSRFGSKCALTALCVCMFCLALNDSHYMGIVMLVLIAL